MVKITRKTERLIWLLSMVILVAFFTTVYLERIVKANDEIYEHVKTFNQILGIIKNDYVDELDGKTLMYGAIDGMLKSLNDPYTRFMRPKDFKEMKEETSGKFGGIGIYITIRDEQLMVQSPIPDTPAAKAGLKAYDYIVRIDGASTKGITIEEAMNKLRGEPGSKVKVSILRQGVTDPIDFTITRDVIKIQSVVTKKMEDKNLAYIRIRQFGEETASDLEKMLKEYEKQKVKGLILDLRGNPGGLLTAAWKVSDLFLTKGMIVSTRGRIPESMQEFTADSIDYLSGTPMVVLVDNGSASASEIVTGALKDNKRATIVGEKTFGKGVVQTVRPLSQDTALSFTTAKYYTPSGVCIHGIGIQPDVEVKVPVLTEEQLKAIRKLFDGKYIDAFLKQVPAPTKADLENFQVQLKAKEISLDADTLRKLVRAEMNRDKDLVYDLEEDIQLQKAVEILASK
jgi:carboxyl-terminal processing protease